MADRTRAPDTPELRARWGSFERSKENKSKADDQVDKCPKGRAKSPAMRLISFALLAVSAPASGAELADSPIVDATIAALKAGESKELNWQVTEVGNIQFPRQSFFERGEIFEVLAGCEAKETERLGWRGYVLYKFEWNCPQQVYIGRLVPDKAGRTVAFVDFFEQAEFKANEERIPGILTPPPPITLYASRGSSAWEEDRKIRQAARLMKGAEIAERFAHAFRSGDFSSLENRFGTYQAIRFGFDDTYGGNHFIEKVWRIEGDLSEGAPALSAASKYARDRLGEPLSASCQPSGVHVECRWQFSDAATALKAKVHVFREDTPEWGFKVFEFRYQTKALMDEAERRAKNG